MIHIVISENALLYKGQMDQASRLRHRNFSKQQSWCALANPGGRPLDERDNGQAVHMLYVVQGKVLGFQRLLPTTRPHLLSDIIPELYLVDPPVGAHIWEMSHHSIAPDHPSRSCSASTIANALGLALVQWGLECGVTHLIIEIDPAGLLPLVQLNFQPLPLGLPCKIRGKDTIAVMIAFDHMTLERFRQMRGPQRRGAGEPMLHPALSRGLLN
jgi:acyl-homoserine lactone synthase